MLKVEDYSVIYPAKKTRNQNVLPKSWTCAAVTSLLRHSDDVTGTCYYNMYGAENSTIMIQLCLVTTAQ